MSKFRSLKNSLIGGEISPTVYGRTDMNQFPHGCKTLKNMIPMVSGGAYRRPGTLFEFEFLEASNTAPKLIPFVVSQTESYMIAIYNNGGSTKLRIMRPTDTFQPSTASNASGYVTFKTVYDSAIEYDEVDDIQFVQSIDVLWLTHPNYRPMAILRLGVDSFQMTAYNYNTSGATFRDSVPYRDQCSTGSTIAPSATSGSGITLTLAPDASDSFRFQPGHVGALIKIDHGGTIGCAQITGYTSGTVVTANVQVNFALTSASSKWWESSWSDYRGWPRAVGLFRSRLMFAGTATERDSVWFSQTANFKAFSVAALTQSKSWGDGLTTGPHQIQPWQEELSSSQLNYVQWISSGDTITVGTQGEEWVIESLDGSVDFGADNRKAHSRTAYGSSFHQAARVGDELFTVTPSDDEVRAFVFNVFEQSYVSQSLQVLFEHYPKAEVGLRKKKFRGICWDESRKTLWCVDTAGRLFGMTRDRALGINAWHEHELGGYDPTVTGSDILSNGKKLKNLCSGSVISAAVLPNPSDGVNDLWLVVKRKINGSWRYHIERMIGKAVASDTAFSSSLIGGGYYQADSCVYDGNFVATGIGVSETYISAGLYANYNHLKNAVVVGTAESSVGIFSLGQMTANAVLGPNTGVTLNSPYPPDYETLPYNLAIGLPYSSVVEPLFADQGSQVGTSQGAAKRLHKVLVRFWKTLASKVGVDAATAETLIFRTGDTPMGESPDLFTGLKRTEFSGDYVETDDASVYILQDEPLPFAVTSVVAEGQVYDG